MQYLMPFNKIRDFENLALELPLALYIILVFILFICSNRMNLFYGLLLIVLPIFAYILIHKIIIEKYFQMQLMNQNYILYYDFFKLFFTGFTPFIIFRYLSIILGLKSNAGFINYMVIIYTVYIGGKLFFRYFLSITFINRHNIRYYRTVIQKDEKVVYFIYLIIYYLISHILNL
jgi:hypothetical protein